MSKQLQRVQTAGLLSAPVATAQPGGTEAKGYPLPKGKDVTLRVTVSTRQDITEVWKGLGSTTEQWVNDLLPLG